MKVSLHSPAAAARTRRWRVPPPLTRTGEMLEGAEILNEMESEIGVLLWKSLRNVTLWAATMPRDQEELFSSGARARREAEILAVAPDEEIAEPLRILAAILDNEKGLRHETVALACRQISQWTHERQAPQTSLAFTQAAALACPGDAELAYHVGRMARQQVQHARAESWYRRAVMLGRQTGNWQAYGWAYLGLGNLAKQRGSLPGARRSFIKAMRAARRHGLVGIQAAAFHDLFVLAVDGGESVVVAHGYARQAMRLYGAGNVRLPMLAQDVCVLWVAHGEFARAAHVLRAVVPHLPERERMLGLANLARAAGSSGDHTGFETASFEAVNLLSRHNETEWAAQSLLNLARGAAGLGLWDRAANSARQAIHLASECGQNNVIFEAEVVLSYADSRTGMSEMVEAPEESRAEWADVADAFEEDMVEMLTGAA